MTAAILFCPGVLFAVNFTAALDRDTITLGESATLTLTFEGGQPSSISQPSVPNLQFSDRGSSQNISFVNGQMSAVLSETFEVTARQTGDYTIPAIQIQMGGQTLASQPLKLKVLKPDAPLPETIAAGTQLAFLKLAAPKKEFYIGETAVVQIDLCLRNEVQGIGQFQFMTLATDGFTSGKWVQGQQRQMRIGNTVYHVVPLSLAVTAIKTGTFALGPITAKIIVELPGRNLIENMQGGEQRQLTLATEEQKVQLLPLPTENMPRDFRGAVGNYTMAVTAGPTNLSAGDPITVKVQITGRGSLDSLTLPEQSEWQNFKTYPPTSKLDVTDSLGLQGTKSFEEIVVPQNSDIRMLPSFSFSFFDPDQKKYQTLTQPAVPLLVRPSSSATIPLANGARAGQDNQPGTHDIISIKQRIGEVAQITPPLLRQRWFVALQSVPLLAFFGAVVWRKRNESLANNPRLRRQRLVAQLIRDGLNDLRKFAAENNSDAFFATLFRLLQEQIGERLDVPASAITEAVVDERLRSQGVPEKTLADLHELFQTCNLARYAPIKSSRELAAIIPTAEAVLNELRESK
jgi:hypothetical protein